MKLSLISAAHFSLHYGCSIGALSVAWWERNFSMTHGTDGSEKGHFAHLLHLQSPNSSNSLLPLANVISFSSIVWVLTKCRPTAMFFPLEEIGKRELSLPLWWLHCDMFVLVCFYAAYSPVNSVTFICPAHLQVSPLPASGLLTIQCHQRCVAHSVLLHIKSTLEGFAFAAQILTSSCSCCCFHMGNHILDILFYFKFHLIIQLTNPTQNHRDQARSFIFIFLGSGACQNSSSLTRWRVHAFLCPICGRWLLSAHGPP